MHLNVRTWLVGLIRVRPLNSGETPPEALRRSVFRNRQPHDPYSEAYFCDRCAPLMRATVKLGIATGAEGGAGPLPEQTSLDFT
jgi:hypothetical protein